MSQPSVSVLIAVLNGASTIAAQLRSLAGQTYQGPLEIVVADNGSSDGTAALVRDLASELPVKIDLVDASAKRGAPFALNRAAEAATGDLLLICDADDIATSEWVESMVLSLANSRFVAGRLRPFLHTPGDMAAAAERTNVDPWHGYCNSAATANVGLHRETFETLGGIDERFLAAYDVDLAVRAHEQGVSVTASPGAMWYRQRDGIVAWSRNLAWCVSWDIAVQAGRRAGLERVGGYQGFAHCVRDFAQQFLDPRRWPRSRENRAFWASQTRIKWGRVQGHLRKARRLRSDSTTT